MKSRQLTDTAVLIGTSPEGQCTYSAQMELGDYWDGEHLWDDSATIVALRLARLQGFLFGQEGQLLQQFESHFNVESGVLMSAWAIHEDGTRTEHNAV
jgi:hypothetical protein